MNTALVAFASRLKAFVSRRRLDEETARDCELHIELLTERYRRAGMAAEDARAAARKQFGNATLLREDVYRMNRIGWLEVLAQDLRYAVRSLRRSPAFTVAAVLTLAIGIGATTAIFSTVNETLLRALPFPHAEQIISIHSRMLDGRATGGGISPAEIASLRSLPLPGIRLAGVQEQPLKAHLVAKDGTPIAITGSGVTEGFFRVLDLPVVAGRMFDHQDYFWSASQRTPVAGILSYHLWRDVFDGNPAVIGKPLPISENLGPSVIVGVAAPQMDLPHGTDFWYALRVDPRSNSHGLEGLLRLDPGVPLGRLESESAAALANLARTTPSDVGRAYVMQPLLESIVGSVSPTLLIVLAATALLLLLACLNVTSLLLARSTARAREIAVRAALGASRLRLASHLLTEALLLAFLGMVIGLGLAYTAVRVLLGLGASKLPRLATVPFDGRVLLFALATLVICTLAIGLMPAWRQAHVGHRALLNEGGHHATPRRAEVRVMSLVIVAEIALAMVLTAGSGWLLKAYDRLAAVDPGFTATGRLVVDVRPGRPFRDPVQRVAWSEAIRQQMQTVPGVALVGSASTFPLRVNRDGTAFVAVPGETDPDNPGDAYVRSIMPGFFTAMGIRLLAGRTFTMHDIQNRAPIVIVNQAFVDAYLTGRNPLTTQFRFGFPAIGPNPSAIVGVVQNVRYASLRDAPKPTIYRAVPLLQQTFVLTARAGDPQQLIAGVRSQLKAFDPHMAPDFDTATDIVASTLEMQRLRTILMLIFGLIALSLAAVGIYGVIAYVLAQRREEIAMRIALGASGRHVFWFIVGGGQRLTLLGVALGLVGAYAGGLVVASRVYAMRASDPIVLAGAAVVVTVVALGATLIPAVRASRLDPGRILRSE